MMIDNNHSKWKWGMAVRSTLDKGVLVGACARIHVRVHVHVGLQQYVRAIFFLVLLTFTHNSVKDIDHDSSSNISHIAQQKNRLQLRAMYCF